MPGCDGELDQRRQREAYRQHEFTIAASRVVKGAGLRPDFGYVLPRRLAAAMKVALIGAGRMGSAMGEAIRRLSCG